LGAQDWDPVFGCGRVNAAQAVQFGSDEKGGCARDALAPQAATSQMSLTQPDNRSYITQRLLVRFTTDQVIATLMPRQPATEMQPLGNGVYLLTVTAGAEWETAQQLLASGVVEYVQPDFVVSVH
jgi:hypothetical protein